MTKQIETSLDTVPSRKSPSTFSDDMDTFLGKLPTWATEINEVAFEINTNATSAASSATAAASSSSSAREYANLAESLTTALNDYQGNWSALTGSLTAGVSVSHGGNLWVSVTSISDATLSEPSQSNSDWKCISMALEQFHALSLYF